MNRLGQILGLTFFLYIPGWSWGQVYSSLNSAKLSCSSEVTLIYLLHMYMVHFWTGAIKYDACSFLNDFNQLWTFWLKTWDDKSGWGKLKRITTQLSPDSNKKKFSQYTLGFMRQSVVKDYNWEKKRGKYVVCVYTFDFYLLFS